MRIEKTKLGPIIKEARKGRGLTQEKLAEKAGIGLRHMMGIENEGSNPSFQVLYAIVRELRIPGDRVFYPDTDPDDPRLEHLVNLLKQCSDSDIRAISALTEHLLDRQGK